MRCDFIILSSQEIGQFTLGKKEIVVEILNQHDNEMRRGILKGEKQRKSRGRDMIRAGIEVGTEYATEEALHILSKETLRQGISGILNHFASVVPHVGSFYMSYRLQRLERNLELFAALVKKHEKVLNDLLIIRGEEEEWRKRVEEVFARTVDAIANEQDIEKIRYFVGGLIKALQTNEIDMTRYTYYLNLLRECSMIDLLILRDAIDVVEPGFLTGPKYLEERNITSEIRLLAMDKLLTIGLFESRVGMVLSRLGEYLSALERANSQPEVGALAQTMLNNKFHGFEMVIGSVNIPLVSPVGRAFSDFYNDECIIQSLL